MQLIRFDDSNYDKKLAKTFSRNYLPNNKLKSAVEKIIDAVRGEGDESIRLLTKKFDRVDLNSKDFKLSKKEISNSSKSVSNKVKNAINCCCVYLVV